MLPKRIYPRFSLTARKLRQRIESETARVVPRGRLNLASTWMSLTVTRCTVTLKSVAVNA